MSGEPAVSAGGVMDVFSDGVYAQGLGGLFPVWSQVPFIARPRPARVADHKIPASQRREQS